MIKLLIGLLLTAPLSADYFYLDDNGKRVSFDLVDPELAPGNVRIAVMRGYAIMCDTKKEVPQYSGNALNCRSCHFCAGNSVGGKNGGISLVGAPNLYPHYFPEINKTLTLEERIQRCFARNLNATPPPVRCKELKAIVSYLNWISSEVSELKNVPWLKLKLLESTHLPDKEKGELVYKQECASCHQMHGEGTEDVPPAWGLGSFTDGSSLAHVKPLAAFIYLNMPYTNANLSEEEALDVAAFVLSHPRTSY